MPILSLQNITINSSSQKRDEVTIILNVDGSALTNPEKTSYGGWIRKHDGNALTNPEKTGYGGLIRKHNGSFLLGLFDL